MSVSDLKNSMPYDEYKGWLIYFNERPVGWREDRRTAMIMRASGAKINPEEIFESLKQLKKSRSKKNNLISSLKNSALYSKMQGMVGGVKIGFDEDEEH